MSSKSQIIFLGSGGTKFAVYDQARGTGGIVIRNEDWQIHLDPGPGASIRAKQFGVDLTKTTAVLVSHDHVDHCNDLDLVIGAMSLGGKNKKGVLVCNQKVVDEELTSFHKDLLSRIFVLDKGDDAKVENVHVVATPTKNHYGAIGFRISTPSFVLGYTADTAFSPSLVKAFEKCDILVINNTLPFGGKSTSQLSSDDTLQLLSLTKPKLAILTHFGKEIIESNPLYDSRELQKKTGIQVIAATDGMIIEPESYAANTSQKNLDHFSSKLQSEDVLDS